MGRLFGTDGVRGVANKELTPELAFKLGKAGAYVLKKENYKPVVIIGKDTRISGDMLENALAAGILAVGGNVIKVGVIPTPAVAFWRGTTGPTPASSSALRTILLNTTGSNSSTARATSWPTCWRRRSKTSSSAASTSTVTSPATKSAAAWRLPKMPPIFMCAICWRR